MAFELMNTQEIHEFGLQVLLQHLTEKGFEIEFAQPNKSEFPHVVAKQGEQLIFILVATDVYPNKGTIVLPILINRHYWNMLKLLQHSLLVLIWESLMLTVLLIKIKNYVPKLLKMHNFILTSADWNSFISKIEVLEDGLTES